MKTLTTLLTLFAACAPAASIDLDDGAPIGGEPLESPALAAFDEGQSTEDLGGVPVDSPADAVMQYYPGATLSGVDVFQTVRIPVLDNGTAVVPASPIIAGKETWIRGHITPNAGFSAPYRFTARLRLRDGQEVRTLTKVFSLSGASNIEDPRTSIGFILPPGEIRSTTAITLELLTETTTLGPRTARFPRDLVPYPLQAQVVPPLDVVVVPIRYDTDGSHRLPDTSAEVMAQYRDQILATFPVSQVNITVRSPVLVDYAIDPKDMTGWSKLLGSIGALRQNDRAAASVYYLGLFNPGATFNGYCGQLCTAGLAPLNQSDSSYYRYGLALGYADERQRSNGIHELGHAMGRPHSPCGGAKNTDPSYPYAGGIDGVQAYDARRDVMYPATHTDLMGYCSNRWISDYTYQQIHTRLHGVRPRNARLTAEHDVFMLAPFTLPAWQGRMTDELAAPVDGLTMFAFDADGNQLDEVLAHRVELSATGLSNLLVPRVSRAAYYEDEEGRRFRVGSEVNALREVQ